MREVVVMVNKDACDWESRVKILVIRSDKLVWAEPFTATIKWHSTYSVLVPTGHPATPCNPKTRADVRFITFKARKSSGPDVFQRPPNLIDPTLRLTTVVGGGRRLERRVASAV